MSMCKLMAVNLCKSATAADLWVVLWPVPELVNLVSRMSVVIGIETTYEGNPAMTGSKRTKLATRTARDHVPCVHTNNWSGNDDTTILFLLS